MKYLANIFTNKSWPNLRLILLFLFANFSLISCESKDIKVSVADGVDFNWDVKPILSENCFGCHGPDEEGRKAGLRLDERISAIGELPESPEKFAIVPWNTEESELIKRIYSADPNVVMPPPESNKTLSLEQKEKLSTWISSGAEYKPHWAFIPPSSYGSPGQDQEIAVLQAENLDGFIRDKLTGLGLTPSARADKQTLVNRLFLTLTGLPPSLKEVETFVSDTSPQSYENLVNTLLSSPQYGEHMTAFWLDLARWSDTDGFLDDHHDRYLWPWRDWVIKSFNENMPIDRFGTLQLAGDLLPNPQKEDVLATTFIRLGKRTTENGAIAEEYEAEYRAERTDNLVGTTFLGLTLGCARCHDHKYDPISQKDYYSISAFFNNTNEPGVYSPGFSGVQGGPTLPWPHPTVEREINETKSFLADGSSKLEALKGNLHSEFESSSSLILDNEHKVSDFFERSIRQGLVAKYDFESSTKATLLTLPEPRERRIPPASINGLGGGPYAPPANPQDETETQRGERLRRELLGRVPRNYNSETLYLMPASLGAAADAVVQDPILKQGHKGRGIFFNETNRGFLGKDVGWYDREDEFSIDFWVYLDDEYDSATLLNHKSEQNSGQSGYDLALEQGKLQVTFAHSPPANMIRISSFEKLPIKEWINLTLTYDGSSKAEGLTIYLDGKQISMNIESDQLTRSMLPWGTGDVFDPFVGLAFGTRFRVKSPVGSGIDSISVYDRILQPAEVAYLHNDNTLINLAPDVLKESLTQRMLHEDPTYQQTYKEVKANKTRLNEMETAVPQVLVMGTAPNQQPTYLLHRGVYSDPRQEVTPQMPDIILPWDQKYPKNRLGLAQWIFSKNNPLTARVFVNRIWQMHFGKGLVSTSEDFGSQGSLPSHPELLDWLTIKFINSGWDLKELHKTIVNSATYQQQSDFNAEQVKLDPENMYYSVGPRWRMTAEMVRDQALALSGQLSYQVGGESVYPYQPEGIWNPLNAFYKYPSPDNVTNQGLYRRSIYTFIKRNAPHPGLTIFDFQNRTTSIARRNRSNTPLQSLMLMNDEQYLEAYRLIASNEFDENLSERDFFTKIYKKVLRKSPTDEQLGVITDYYYDQKSHFSENVSQARQLISNGVTPANKEIPEVELAAMMNVVALVMNMPEAIYVR